MRPRPSRSSVSNRRSPSSRPRRWPAWSLSQTEFKRSSVKCSSTPPRFDVGNSNGPQIDVSVELYPALATPSRFSLLWVDARVLFSSRFPRIDLSQFDWRMGMERRRFIVKAGGALVAVGATAAIEAPNVIARLKIQVFAAGELMPAFGCFDAASQGTIECFMSAPYYWAGKEPGMQWFSAVPFGLNPQGMMAWYLHGDGLKLWEETYATFNLVPRPGPSTGVQMDGWFRKKMNSIADYKGLKMRIPGLGGKIVGAAGGTVVLTPGGEI